MAHTSGAMKAILPLVLLVSLPMWAKEKPHYDYRPATLVSFHDQSTGNICSGSANTTGSVDANTDSAGLTSGSVNATTYGSSSCSDTTRRLYTIRADANTFVLTVDHSTGVKLGAAFSAGIGPLFMKNSVLANRLPGTPVLVRADGKHMYVKIDKRESMYAVVEAK